MTKLLSILDAGTLAPISGGTLPSNHERRFIPGGPKGTELTVEEMRKLVSTGLKDYRDSVTKGKRDYRLRKTIRQIIDACPPKDYYCYAEALYKFCRDKIKYAFDPAGVELIEHPDQVLESGLADCDSNAILLATMYEAIGLPSKFVTIKADPTKPDEYSHVFVKVKIPKHGWVAADPIMPYQQFGWEPEPSAPRREWPASFDDSGSEEEESNDGVGNMFGLGEGPVPGVVDIPSHVTGKPWDWRQQYYEGAEPLPPSALFGLGDFDGLGVIPNLGIRDLTYGMIDGTTYSNLRAAQSEQMNMNASVAGKKLDIDRLPAGPGKQDALNKWNILNAENRKAYDLLRQSIDSYNNAARIIRGALDTIPGAGDVHRPTMLAGDGIGDLGIFGIDDAVTALLVIGAVYVAMQGLASIIASWNGQAGKVKSIFDNVADSISAVTGAVGSVVGAIPPTISATADLTKSLLVGAAVLGSGFLVYKLGQQRGWFAKTGS